MKRVLDEQFVKVAVGDDGERQVYRRVDFHVNESLESVADVTWTEGSDKEAKEWEEMAIVSVVSCVHYCDAAYPDLGRVSRCC